MPHGVSVKPKAPLFERAVYKPEEIIGQRVTLLANLAPRKIRGIESKGMILMAENEKGELCFIAPTKDFGNGSGIS